MRITESQLRRIIRQEIRALNENQIQPKPRVEAMLQIGSISEYAAAMGTSVYKFLGMMQEAAPYPGVKFLTPDGRPGYSKETDTLTVSGTQLDLEDFARALDEMLLPDVQSIADEDSFVNGIMPV